MIVPFPAGLNQSDHENRITAMHLTLEPFLQELIAILKQDHPREIQKMIMETQGITWLQTLDRETTLIRVTSDDIIIGEKNNAKKIDVRINLSRKILFDLLEGKISLDKALQTKDLEIYGKPVIILKCYKIWEQILLLSRISPRFYFLTYQLR
jgi:hypothetical protein